MILGPVQLGDNISVGAGAVVVKNADNNSTLVGIPAKALSK